jgi:hypothetical protein
MCTTTFHQPCPRCGRPDLAVQQACQSGDQKTACHHCGYGLMRVISSKNGKKPTCAQRNIAAGVLTYALTAFPEDTVRLFLSSARQFAGAMNQLRRDLNNGRIVRETARLTCWNETLEKVEVLFGPELSEDQPSY